MKKRAAPPQKDKLLNASRTVMIVSSSLIVPSLIGDLLLQNTTVPVIIMGSILAASLIVALISSVIFLIKYGQRDLTDDKPVHSTAAKIISVATFGALAVCMIYAIKALNVNIVDATTNHRFIFEGLARSSALLAILGIILLNAMQTGIYFLSRDKRKMKLDERQARERQEVFETSYKVGGLMAFLIVMYFGAYASNAGNFLALNNSLPAGFDNAGILPDMYFYPLYVMVLALFALPLTIAAWRKKSS